MYTRLIYMHVQLRSNFGSLQWFNDYNFCYVIMSGYRLLRFMLAIRKLNKFLQYFNSILCEYSMLSCFGGSQSFIFIIKVVPTIIHDMNCILLTLDINFSAKKLILCFNEITCLKDIKTIHRNNVLLKRQLR